MMDTFRLFTLARMVANLPFLIRDRAQIADLARRCARCPGCARGDLCAEHAYQRDLLGHGLYDDYRAWLASDDWTVPREKL